MQTIFLNSETLYLQKHLKPPNPKQYGWSEPAATNAPVEDEPIQPVLRMNILPARRDFFLDLLSALKFSTSPFLPTPSYLPPPTYPLPSPPPLLPPPSYLPPTNPTPPHSIARAPKTSSDCGAGARAAGWSWSWTS